MAVSNKVKEWFKREHGYSLDDAFDVMQPERAPRREDKEQEQDQETVYIGRGYPFDSMISLDGIDSENLQLADEIVKKVSKLAK